jgi:hypothetical protein
MPITLDGTAGITNDATDLNYTGTLTGGTGVINIGSGQLYKDASGNVGIGTSSPLGLLDVNGTGFFRSGSVVAGTRTNSITGGALEFSASSTESVIQAFNRPSFPAYNLRLNTQTNIQFDTASTERMRIDSSGNLLVATTSAISVSSGSADGLTVYSGTSAAGVIQASANGNIAMYLRRRSSNGAIAQFHRDTTNVGRIDVTTTSTSYVTSSDYRLKHDIQPMTGALAKVAALKPVTYKWNADDSQSQGFIAHELQEVVPECVTGEKDAVDADGKPQYQGIDTSFLVATLTAAIQEQQAIIEQLKADVAELKGAQA